MQPLKSSEGDIGVKGKKSMERTTVSTDIYNYVKGLDIEYVAGQMAELGLARWRDASMTYPWTFKEDFGMNKADLAKLIEAQLGKFLAREHPKEFKKYIPKKKEGKYGYKRCRVLRGKEDDFKHFLWDAPGITGYFPN